MPPAQAFRRHIAVLVLGVASGLPLALTGQAMQAWLTIEGVDVGTIGVLGLVGLPYTFKFLWAPLMDRFEPPFFGRRRGWLILTQLALAAALMGMSALQPVAQSGAFLVAALLVAALSASQDIVVDAFRTDLLPARERGLGSSLSVFGYRLGMILSGGVALVWAEAWGSWPQVYAVMAKIMLGIAIFSAVALPRLEAPPAPAAGEASRELLGFAAMLLGVLAGAVGSRFALELLGFHPADPSPWVQLLFVGAGIGAALPLALFAARRAGFRTLTGALDSWFAQPQAWAALLLVVLYRLGDSFTSSLATPFFLGVGFGQAEVGVAYKIIGIWLTILGAMAGGALMLRMSLLRALMAFGALQLVSNLGFWALSLAGRGALGALELPAVDLLILRIPPESSVDTLLMLVVAGENLAGGMGTAAYVALLMGLCRKGSSATDYALLSGLAALGRVLFSPVAGFLAQELGWPSFFLISTVVALPGLLMVWRLRRDIEGLAAAEAK